MLGVIHSAAPPILSNCPATYLYDHTLFSTKFLDQLCLFLLVYVFILVIFLSTPLIEDCAFCNIYSACNCSTDDLVLKVHQSFAIRALDTSNRYLNLNPPSSVGKDILLLDTQCFLRLQLGRTLTYKSYLNLMMN